jgi:hypothetical protein
MQQVGQSCSTADVSPAEPPGILPLRWVPPLSQFAVGALRTDTQDPKSGKFVASLP